MRLICAEGEYGFSAVRIGLIVVAAAAAVAAAVGDPGGTRNDEAVTGAGEAPVVTIVVGEVGAEFPYIAHDP